MVVQTQTPRLRQIRKTNLELIFSDHNAYCLPPCQNKCPSHIDIPGFLKANTEGNFVESARIFKRTIPFPSVLGRVCPAPCEEHCRRDEVEEAIAIRDSHRYAGDQVLKAQAAGVKAPVPFEVQPATGKRVAVIGSGPAGHVRRLLPAIAGHEVTVFERDPAPGGMLRYGIPQYRLPKVEVLEAEYQSAWDLGVKLVTNAELGKDFTLDDLQNQGFDAVCVAIGCYDTNKLGIPGEDADGVLDGLEYLRIATLGLPYPGHVGQARRGHRRRLHVDGLLAHLGPPGRRGGHARLPPRHEGHARRERGPRDDRGGRAGHLPGRADARRDRRQQQGHGRRVPAHGARRARRVGPAPPGAGGRHRVRHRLRPRAAGHRPGARARLARTRLRRRHRDQAPPARGGCGHVRAPAGRGVFGTGDVRIGAATVVEAVAEGRRAAYAIDAYLQGQDLDAIKTRQTLAEPQPEFLSIVPYTSEVKEPRIRLKAMPAEVRNKSYIEYEIPYTQQEAMAESARCLQCTCEAIGYCDLRRQGIEYGTTLKTLEPERTGFSASAACPRTASPAPTTTTSATTATRSSCASRPAASTAAAARTCARRSSARPATTSCAPASTRS